MTPPFAGVCRKTALICGLLACLGSWRAAFAQVESQNQDGSPPVKVVEKGPTEELMRKLATEIEIYSSSENNAQEKSDIVPYALMRSYDPARGREFNQEQEGMLYAYGRKGRPTAIIEVWRWKGYPNQYGLALFSTTTGVLHGKVAGQDWRPEKPGLEFHALDQPSPASFPDKRTAQMIELAEEFRAHELQHGQTIPLHLVPYPVHRYQAENLDGAVFAFAHSHNPEAILFIEAFEEPESKAAWRFAASPCTSHEVRVAHLGDEFVAFPQAADWVGGPNETFWNPYVTAREGKE